MTSLQINLWEFPHAVIKDGIDLEFSCIASVFGLCSLVSSSCWSKARKDCLFLFEFFSRFGSDVWWRGSCPFHTLTKNCDQKLLVGSKAVRCRNQRGQRFLKMGFLKSDINFLLSYGLIKLEHAVMNSILMCATPLFFPCHGLSFGTVCLTLNAWEVKPA